MDAVKVRSSLARYRVRSAYLLGLIIFFLLHPCQRVFFYSGMGISFCGLLLRSWAAGCIKKSKILATQGPYAWIRHPLYFGSFLIAFGFGVCVFCPERPWPMFLFWFLFCAYFAMVYYGAIAKEEASLEQKFGAEWFCYKANVPAILPYRFLGKRGQDGLFSLNQYLQNKEYLALAGWLTIALYLLIVFSGGNFGALLTASR